MNTGDDAFSPLYRDSRYCAPCHEGTLLGVPVYTTYSEWLASPDRRQGKQCQTCHMAPTGRMSNFAPGKGGIERDPATLGNHHFIAGTRQESLRRVLNLTPTLACQGATVQLDLEVQANGTGHRLPTGYVDRHLILVVDAFDAAGGSLPALSGPLLPSPAGRALAGRPGRLYARLLRDFAGRSPVPFWQDVRDVIDTRLQADQPDRMTFTFSGRTVEVRLRLLFRRFWKEVADAKGWPDNEIEVIEQIVPMPRQCESLP